MLVEYQAKVFLMKNLRAICLFSSITTILVLGSLHSGALAESGNAQISDPLEMVPVPAGTFTMGARHDGDDDRHASDDEYPRHEVTLSAYEIGKYEVTNGQMVDVLNWALNQGYLENAAGQSYSGQTTVYSHGEPLIDIHTEDNDSQIVYDNSSFDWRNRGGYSMEDHPVLQVSWYGAVCFANWLSEMEGRTRLYDLNTWELVDQFDNGYRLPTEAEWERAAAWDGTKHWIYGYQSDNPNANRMNYNDSNPLGLDYPYTTPVGFYDGSGDTIDSPSPVGAYDMSGNLYEWVHDWYARDYYEGGAMTNPTGPSTDTYKVRRGGSCYSEARDVRTAARWNFSPSSRPVTLGFRLVIPGTNQPHELQ